MKGSILIAHSAINADSVHLTTGFLQHFQRCRQKNQVDVWGHSRIVGYIDTLPLFRSLYPNLASYKQKDLVRHFLGGKSNAGQCCSTHSHDMLCFKQWVTTTRITHSTTA